MNLIDFVNLIISDLTVFEMLDSPATSNSNILNMSGVGMGVVKWYTDNFQCILFCARDWPV